MSNVDFTKFKNKKLPKRALAQAFRRGAELLDKYGWVQSEMGSKSNGFCAMGALENLVYGDNEESETILKHVTFNRKAEPGGLLKENKIGRSTQRIYDRIINFNDNLGVNYDTYGNVTDESTEKGKKQVQKLFRTLARGLEHGREL